MKIIKCLFVCNILFSSDLDTRKNTHPPNVVIIFTDDQGYGDLGSFGSMDIKTPNIDSLANDGAILTDFLVCLLYTSPSPRDS